MVFNDFIDVLDFLYFLIYLLYKYNPGVWGHFEATLPHGRVPPPGRSFYFRKYHMDGMKYNIYGVKYDVYDQKSLKYLFYHINYDEKCMPELFLTSPELQNNQNE